MIFSELHSGSLIQIPFKLLPLNQRTISVHDIEIFVGVLVNQHPKLSFTDVIIPGGFLNSQRVSAPHRNGVFHLAFIVHFQKFSDFPCALAEPILCQHRQILSQLRCQVLIIAVQVSSLPFRNL